MYSPEEIAPLQQAMQALQGGQPAAAEALLTDLLGRWPANAEALHLLGLIEAQSGRPEQGLALIGQALALQPQAAHMHANLARLLQALGRADEAAAHYRRVTAIEPGNTAAWFALAELCYDLQRIDDARAAYERVTALDPAHAAAWLGLGNAGFVGGDDAAAEQAYMKVLALRPESPGAFNNLGYIAYRRKDYPQAQAWVEKALALSPDYPEAWENLATIHRATEQLEAAAQAYEQVCRLSHRPGLVVKNALLVPGVYRSQAELDAWRARFDQHLDQLLASDLSLRDPSAEVGEMPFFLHYQGLSWVEQARKLAAFYRQACPALSWTAPHLHAPRRQPGARLRIGIVSMHYRPGHSIGKLFGSLVGAFDSERFELTLALITPPRDPETQAFIARADRFLELPKDLFAARAALAEARFDIILYPEIGSDYITYFLAFARLAPLQAVIWGLGTSTGLDSLDAYYSSEALETEASRACYTEPLVTLPHMLPRFARPDYPGQTMTRAEFGLPAGLLFGCLQSSFKLHPAFDATLARLLGAVPGSHLVLFQGQYPCWDDKLRARLQQSLGAAYAQVCFVPRQPEQAYLQLAGCCDVLLDPWPICGGNTTYDVLVTGTPLVTRTGPMLSHRLSHAIYTALGYTDCVTDSAEAYYELALRLALDPAERARRSGEILARLDNLYDRPEGNRELVDHLYQAYFKRGAAEV